MIFFQKMKKCVIFIEKTEKQNKSSKNKLKIWEKFKKRPKKNLTIFRKEKNWVWNYWKVTAHQSVWSRYLQFMPFRFRELCNTFNFVILGRIQFACCLRHTRNWLDLLPPMEVPCICTPHFTWQPVMATSKHDFYSHHECYLQTRYWWKKAKLILAFREKYFWVNCIRCGPAMMSQQEAPIIHYWTSEQVWLEILIFWATLLGSPAVTSLLVHTLCN